MIFSGGNRLAFSLTVAIANYKRHDGRTEHMQALVLANFYSVLLKRLRHLPLGCTLSLLETLQISYNKHITRSEARAAVVGVGGHI